MSPTTTDPSTTGPPTTDPRAANPRLGHLAPTAFPILPGDLWAALRCGSGARGSARGAAPASDVDDPWVLLRRTLAHRLDVADVLPTASGRTALALLLQGLVAQAGDFVRNEVILPAYTCPSLVKVILDAGLIPRLVDLTPATLEFAPQPLAAALSTRTLAVIFVHPFGLPLELDGVRAAAHAVGAVLIEDAAQAMGARIAGRYAGTIGDFGIFSVGPGKPLAAGGGGFLTVNHQRPTWLPQAWLDEELPRRWAQLKNPGAAATLWSGAKLGLVGLLFHPWGWQLAWRMGIGKAGDSEMGQRYEQARMTRVQCGAVLQLWATWEANTARRQIIALGLKRALASIPQVTMVENFLEQEGRAEPAWLRFPLFAPDLAQRDAWVDGLQRAGIGAGKMYRISLAARFPDLGHAPEEFPGAQAIAERLLTLPTHHYVDENDVARMATLMRRLAFSA